MDVGSGMRSDALRAATAEAAARSTTKLTTRLSKGKKRNRKRMADVGSMDITGARWGLGGAEAVLKLRAIVGNGDFAESWRYHLTCEHERVHRSRFAGASPCHLGLAA